MEGTQDRRCRRLSPSSTICNLTTLRKQLTKLEKSGYSAGSLVLHPLDWENVELALASSNDIEHLLLPYDAATRRLFVVPVVATVSEAAGVGHVLARDAVVVDTDTIGVGVQWSETSNTDDFAKSPSGCAARAGSGPRCCLRWAWCPAT